MNTPETSASAVTGGYLRALKPSVHLWAAWVYERLGKLGWDDVKRAWGNMAAVFAALAVMFVFHAALAAVIVACMAGLEWFIEWVSVQMLHGQEILVYGELKLSYVFQTIDIVLIAGVGVHAIVDAYLIMRDAHQKHS